ncbi:MAG: hypothetical protein IKZ58_06975, partial [Selenomonadaceae bacterium]|nr:hypothetical protein [Selenomonadaceae bacterium]
MKDSILKVRRVLSVILPDNSTEFGDDAESIKKFSFDLQRFKDFYNEKNNKVITGTADNDSIRNWGSSNVTISGGDGNDSVYSSGDRVTISGGAGDDSIYSFGDKVTINGGTGDDTISSWNFDSVGTVYEYNSGDGNDVIMGLTSKDTLLINGTRKEIARKNDGDIIVGVGNNSITIKNYNLVNYKSNTAIIGTSYFDEIGNSGNNVTISGCDGNDSICNNAGSKVIINGGGGNDSIVNYGDNGTIKGDTGNDYIFNEGDYASISGGEGNDSIYNMYAAQDVMISGGDGNDYISNDWWSNWDVTINGGAGDDTIISHGYNVTINGGTGNDKISLSSSDYSSLRVIEYVKGDGNDLVQGFQASDTLIISGTKYSTVKSGNDVIVTAGSGKITLQGAASLSSINIKGTLGGGSDTGSGGKDTTPSGKNISNLKASTLVTGTAYNDTIKNSSAQVTIQGGDGKDKISLTSGATKNVIIGGTGNDSIYSSVTSGVLYKYAKGDGNDYIKGWTAKDTLTITGGAYKTSTTSSNVIVSVEGGEKITLAGAKGKTININPANLNVVGTSSADKINNSLSSATINALAGNDTIINSGANVYIDAGTGVDKITLKSSAKKNTVYGGAGNDTIYSSVTSGVMYLYNNGDGNDVIKSWTANDTISISGAEYTTLKSGSNIIVGVDSGQITLMGASGKNLNIKGILHQDNKGTSGADKVNNSLSGETINALAGNDTIINSGANVYIDAGTGADKITLKSSAKKNTVYGGAGNDTIYSSVTSGVMYLYNNGDGNDVIKSWTANDTISISGAEYTTLTSGSNVIVGVDSGKITLVGASGKTLNIKGILHQDNKGTSDADKINNSLSGETINALAGNDTIINSGANVYIDAGTG